MNPRAPQKEKDDRVWGNIVFEESPSCISCFCCKNVKRYEVIEPENSARR